MRPYRVSTASSISPLEPGLVGSRTILLTGLALICFAANSILCRLALAPRLIDPLTFTTVRVLSAAVILSAIIVARRRRLPRLSQARGRSTVALLLYAVFFSLAYARLTTGTGALVLFGMVQLTMLSVALGRGERFSVLSWVALAVAALGLITLVAPGVTAPDPLGAILMAVSGVAWGFYSLLARSAGKPVEANATNFLICFPVVVIANGVFAGGLHVTAAGLGFAVASGAFASGLGYAVWYAALQGLPATHAAIVQLSVPAIAALGGVVMLAEPITPRLVVASGAVLGGVAVVLRQKTRHRSRPGETETRS